MRETDPDVIESLLHLEGQEWRHDASKRAMDGIVKLGFRFLWRPPHAGDVSTIKRGVSLYSLQEEYFLRTMSLGGLHPASPPRRRPGHRDHPRAVDPRLPAHDRRVLDTGSAGWSKYGTTPVATDLFLDTKRYPDRWLTLEEQVASVHRDIDIAVRLGATVIRAIINTPPEVMEGAAPYAEATACGCCWRCTPPSTTSTRGSCEHLEVMHRTAVAGTRAHARHGHLRRAVPARRQRPRARATAPSPSSSTHRQDLRRPRRHPRADGHRQLPRRRPDRDRAGPPGDALHLDRPADDARRTCPSSGTSRPSSTR